jgi:hypothetical protein
MFPIDVVKSKIQASRAVTAPGVRETFRAHYQQEGLKGFYKGWSVAILRSLPAHAVVLTCYSQLMQLML